MGKSERVEGQESLHTAGGPTGYLFSATKHMLWHIIIDSLYVYHNAVTHIRLTDISKITLNLNSVAHVPQTRRYMDPLHVSLFLRNFATKFSPHSDP